MLFRSVTGITSSADNSGTLELQAISGLVNMNNVTGALAMPTGTTAQRPSSPIAGQMRYNTTTQQIEVYDGSSWIGMSQTATVGLSMPAEDAIRWAQTKMAEEADLKLRLEKHPGLKDGYEKFQVMDILCKEEDAQ